MKNLPLLISIPHGGSYRPRELMHRINLCDFELFFEGDAFTNVIYDLSSAAEKVIIANIPKALVDINRDPDHLPPKHEDGLIKDVTTFGVRVYKEGREPDAHMIDELIRRYHKPYHDQIREALKNPAIELALDCHSMAAIGPPLAKDQEQTRPLICLGNAFGKTCSNELLEKLKGCFMQAFSLDQRDVALNDPFAGGYIVRRYGNKPLPWVQVEMSRGLYMKSPWFDRVSLTVDDKRLGELNRMFQSALNLFFST